MFRVILGSLGLLIVCGCASVQKPSSASPEDSKTKLIPVGEVNAYEGFKVESVEAGSIYDRAGVKQGDIIESINGKEFHSSADATPMFEQLKSSKVVEFLVLRSGQQLVLKTTISQ